MSTLLIATDEAGYGPKLGPLVIVGTAWQIPDNQRDGEFLNDLFVSMRSPFQCGPDRVVVDDSKAVFIPAQGLGALHAAVSAAMHWTGKNERNLYTWLTEIADSDLASIFDTPWLGQRDDCQFLDQESTRRLREHWQQSGIGLSAIRSRIITAREFNSQCSAAHNKADLLSESTIGLVRSLIELQASQNQQVIVFCDRHGGRRYYGGVLQHSFPEWQMQVVSETKHQSRYRLTRTGQTIEIAFTVKGDTFTPVALSSMIAKYLRERLMESLNAYFAKWHRGSDPLKPTAGYPVDADRFLQQIEPIIKAKRIPRIDLIRSR
jgi:ribonuclease HII